MTCFLPPTKGDRQFKGGNFKVPLLSRLCPVSAYEEWIAAARLTAGPVFRAIDRWGNISDNGLNIDSLVPLLRNILQEAGVDAPELYSAHSLRRGFASWATANGWDLKTLMEHVGWKTPNPPCATSTGKIPLTSAVSNKTCILFIASN